MSGINVIVTFETRPECAASFSALLEQVRHDLPQVSGCRGVQVFDGAGEASLFTLVEQWDTEAAHQAHIGHVIASGAWERIAAQLARDPVSRYYRQR